MSKKTPKKPPKERNSRATTFTKEEILLFCQLINKAHMGMDITTLLRHKACRSLYRKFANMKNNIKKDEQGDTK